MAGLSGTRHTIVLMGVSAVVALGLTACTATADPADPTGGASPSAESGARSDDGASSTPAVDEPAAEHGDIILGVAESFGMGRTFEPPPGPLDLQYGASLYLTSDEDAHAQRNEIENEIVACMAEHGFDYAPVRQDGDAAGSTDGEGPPWGTEAYVEEKGYGITTRAPDDPAKAPGDPRADEMPVNELENENEIKNQEYASSLSQAAQVEFWSLLDGATGCRYTIIDKLWAGSPWLDPQFDGALDTLMTGRNAASDAVPQDARLIAARQAWGDCMADAGYPGLGGLGDAMEQIWEQWYELTETSEPDLDAIEELRSTELAIAATDLDCTRSTEIHSVALAIRDTAEQEFIDRHRAELDELVAAFLEHEATKND